MEDKRISLERIKLEHEREQASREDKAGYPSHDARRAKEKAEEDLEDMRETK